MDGRPAHEAEVVAAALRHLDVDVVVDGATIRLRQGGEPITVHSDEPGLETAQIVVRERVSPATRRMLSEAGIGWLDLRGRLSVRAPGLVVEADVPGAPGIASQRRTRVLAGAVVSGVTIAALATWPDPLPGVRATARMIDATPGGVSLAFKRLASAGLLTVDHRATRDLFWAAADEWRPDWVELPLSAVSPDSTAVAVGGLAAARLGAPVAVTSGTSAEILVASPSLLRYAALAASSNPSDGPTARFAVAPAPIATTLLHPAAPTVEGVRVAAEAVVALSLAIDPARGAETVRSWDGTPHVWS